MAKGMFGNPAPRMLLANDKLRECTTAERTFVVCGVQRGGTSMVAGVIRSLGVDMGPAGMNHEDAAILDCYSDPKKIKKYIINRNREATVWGFKLPHILNILDDLLCALRNPLFIIVFRNAVSNLDSFVARGDHNFADGLQHLELYYSKLLQLCRADFPMILVSYERAAAAPVLFVDELLRVTKLKPTRHERAAAVKVITGDGGGYSPPPEIWHHLEVIKRPRDGNAVTLLPIKAEQFYDIDILGTIDTTRAVEITLWLEITTDFNDRPNQFYWLKILIDSGNGFDMLRTYNLMMPLDDAAIKLTHQGAIIRIGVGVETEKSIGIAAIRYLES